MQTCSCHSGVDHLPPEANVCGDGLCWLRRTPAEAGTQPAYYGLPTDETMCNAYWMVLKQHLRLLTVFCSIGSSTLAEFISAIPRDQHLLHRGQRNQHLELLRTQG